MRGEECKRGKERGGRPTDQENAYPEWLDYTEIRSWGEGSPAAELKRVGAGTG